jgi:hypothetical protein
VQLYRPTSVVEIAAITIDMIRTDQSKDAAPSWIFDRTRYLPANTHYAVGIGEVEIRYKHIT